MKFFYKSTIYVSPAWVLAWCSILVAQPTATDAGASNPDSNASQAPDIAEGRRLLEQVEDGTFAFDDPAFYWFCRHVAQKEHQGLRDANESATDWQFLLERPSDYRGWDVLLEGVLQRRTPFAVSNRPGLDILYQCELSNPGTRAIASVVVVEDPGGLPHLGRVRARGYFIKNRAFETTGGDIGQGPLVVARRLEPAGELQTSVEYRFPGASAPRWLIPMTAGLAVVWLVLRRRTKSRRRGAELDMPSRSDNVSDDFEWLRKMEDGDNIFLATRTTD